MPSTIVWDNRGTVSDGFAAVFGANANLARSDVDAALADWQNLIANFNYSPDSNPPDTFTVDISVGGTGFGASTSYGGGWQINGKPSHASIGIGGGSNGQGAGWYLDPSPSTYEEFEGNIITPYTLSATPGGPADGKFDLYSIVAIEFAHAAGLNDAGNELFTSDPNHYLTNTGQADVACSGTLWTYHGPDVNALFTSDNGCNQNRSNALHTALPALGNQVTSGGVTYYGADDIDVPVYYASRRYLPSNLAAQVLHDSYGYTISAPTYHSAYIDYNPTTHNVLVRDGSHGTGIYPSQNNPSNDVITVFPFFTGFQNYIEINVQIGNPTPGTGPNPVYMESFPASSVSSIAVDTSDGVDMVNIDPGFSTAFVAPVTVNLGSGTDTVNILNLVSFSGVTVNLGSGTDTVNVQQTLAPVAVNGGSGADTVNVQATNAPVTLSLGSSTATVNIGHDGTVQDINGPVTVEDPPAFTVINIDDSADSAAHSNVVLDSFTPLGDSLWGRITGLAPATISYECADTNTLNVKTGTGSTVVNVRATCAILGTNLSNNGPTVVNVGNGNTLAGILGPLNLENEPSTDTVTINDQNDTTLQNAATLSTVVQKGCTCGQLSGLVGVAPIRWDYPDTTTVTINTGRGGIRLTVLGTGVPTFLNGNTLGTNTLVGPNVETTWNVTGANQGNFSSAVATATFTAFQNLTGGSDTDGFLFSDGATLSGTLDGGGGSNGLSLAAYSSSTNLTVNVNGPNSGNVLGGVVGTFRNIEGVEAGHGNDRFVFTNAGSISSIDGGPAGNDTLDASAVTRNLSVLVYGTNAGTVPGMVFEFGDIENVTTGGGRSTVVFSDGASLAGTLTGGAGGTTIDASPYSTGRTFAINAANGGSVAGMLGAFANVQNLIGAGGGGNDFAFFSNGSLAGDLDGGIGNNNLLDYAAYPSAVTVVLSKDFATGVGGRVANIQELRGGAGDDLLIGNGAGGTTFFASPGNDTVTGQGTGNILVGTDADSTWNVTAQDAGTLTWATGTTTFSGVQNLTGDAGADDFIVSDTAAVSGSIDGGGGNNTLDTSAYSSNESFSITGANAGSATVAPTFTGIQNLTGGGGNNTFAIGSGGSLGGTLNGGAGGTNTLDYSTFAGNVVVDLQLPTGAGTGTATNVLGGVSNILNVNGSNLGGPGVYNLLIGNGGNVLTGGTGRVNLLVAGGAASTLQGGNGVDLLIGGTTNFDNTQAGLNQWVNTIAPYWATTADDLPTRENTLASDGLVVTGNGGNNTITGNKEPALIYTDGADTISGFDPNNSLQVPISP